MKALRVSTASTAVVLLAGFASAQEASVPHLEFLMTYQAELEPGQPVTSELTIVNCEPGGWARGPRIKGSFVGPCGDWLRTLPSGVSRLDVRGTLKTDDGALVYVRYNGIIKHSEASARKLGTGEPITEKDGIYFLTAPTFETKAEKYAWLNEVQAIGKLVELRVGPERSYVRYDVYALR